MGRLIGAGAAVVARATAACADQGPPSPGAVEVGGGSASPAQAAPEATQPRRVDPRQGGFEIGFGEFAVTLEAAAIRPGPVTFVIRNGGQLVHGFEMESESENDSSGPGSGDEDEFKIEEPTFDPGEEIRLDLDLAPGVYKIECYVADHSDRGMEILFEVRPDAPRVQQEPAGGNAVAIEGFAFAPATLEVPAGTEVTWTNRDPEAHTVTADDGSFDSGAIDPDGAFSVTFDQSGTVTYVCNIHPAMTGTVRVA
jgi:plastocyanin